MDVLIAHGKEGSRRSLAASLEALGLQLREAADGPEALEALLADEPPRVAVVDWDLPRIEGPELCRLVRDFHIVDPPYIVLLAGSAHHEEVQRGLTAGAHDCVRTPVTSTELQARVEMARRVVELPWGHEEMCGGRCAELEGVLGAEAAVQLLDAELARARREQRRPQHRAPRRRRPRAGQRGSRARRPATPCCATWWRACARSSARTTRSGASTARSS